MGIFKHKEALVLVLGGLMLGHAASAEGLVCAFETECFDTDGCSETDYTLEIVARDGGAVMIDVSEELIAEPVREGDRFAWLVRSDSTVRLLAGTVGESARLTVMDATGAVAITYAGSCVVPADKGE
ncbi:hypothetical protein [Palleronia caenipelagi]|nr:hypothetical protein [Palleronia caenipelagi]